MNDSDTPEEEEKNNDVSFTSPTSSSPTSSVQEIINNILKEETEEANDQQQQRYLSITAVENTTPPQQPSTPSTQWGEEERTPELGTWVPPPVAEPEETSNGETAREPPPDSLRVAPWRGSGLYRYKLYFEEATRRLFERISRQPTTRRDYSAHLPVPTVTRRNPPPHLNFFEQQHRQQQPTGSRLRRLASALAEKVRRVRESRFTF